MRRTNTANPRCRTYPSGQLSHSSLCPRLGQSPAFSPAILKLQTEGVMFTFDYDLVGLFWTTVVVAFASKPQLRKNSRPIPARFDRQIVDESSLSMEQRKYFAPFDAQLAAMNYRPMCTFRVANYGTNLLREYSNPADPAHCTLTVVE